MTTTAFLMSWCPPFPSMPPAASSGLSLRISGRHSLTMHPYFRTQKLPCSVFPLLSLIPGAISPWFTPRWCRSSLDIIRGLETYSQRWSLHTSNRQVLPIHPPALPSHGRHLQPSGSLIRSSVARLCMLLVSPMQKWTIILTTNWTLWMGVDKQGVRRRGS